MNKLLKMVGLIIAIGLATPIGAHKHRNHRQARSIHDNEVINAIVAFGQLLYADALLIERDNRFININLSNSSHTFQVLTIDAKSRILLEQLSVHMYDYSGNGDAQLTCRIEFSYSGNVKKFEFKLVREELIAIDGYKALIIQGANNPTEDLFTSIDGGSAKLFLNNIINLVNSLLEKNGYEYPRLALNKAT